MVIEIEGCRYEWIGRMTRKSMEEKSLRHTAIYIVSGPLQEYEETGLGASSLRSATLVTAKEGFGSSDEVEQQTTKQV